MQDKGVWMCTDCKIRYCASCRTEFTAIATSHATCHVCLEAFHKGAQRLVAHHCEN